MADLYELLSSRKWPDVDDFCTRMETVLSDLLIPKQGSAPERIVDHIESHMVAGMDNLGNYYDHDGNKLVVRKRETTLNPYLSKEPKAHIKRVLSKGTKTAVTEGRTAPITAPMEVRLAQVPGVEWWDSPLVVTSHWADGTETLLLGGQAYTDSVRRCDSGVPSHEVVSALEGDSALSIASAPTIAQSSTQPWSVRFNGMRISHLIQHPQLTLPDHAMRPPVALPPMLTKAERKKKRHMERVEASRVKDQRVAAGLDPPPETRVRLVTMARILSTRLALNPTEVEAKVKEERDRRIMVHEEHQLAQKLTVDEKWQRSLAKVRSDRIQGVVMSVTSVTVSESQVSQFILRINAAVCPRWTDPETGVREFSTPKVLGQIAVIRAGKGEGGSAKAVRTIVVIEGGRKLVDKITKIMGKYKFDSLGYLTPLWTGPVLMQTFMNWNTVSFESIPDAAKSYARDGRRALGMLVAESEVRAAAAW
ncbi:pre-mRNA processing factor 3 (PRP3) [Carpediemonas membranifera]|uniref:Pre-mRNA processing factor 3 (PRP3) n=1 Tax=Carpediemonas membranifera TaxID=201153 RepID=A0A8J6AZK9_9EUKA|nr:pre-mRNA processing factor 3 (PRP3) [Carpediemonas membranifera]|eukprot:KAG9391084.1 pre-mRNA processing factor 3 (PRP3) [Carpediemonas membranifera]